MKRVEEITIAVDDIDPKSKLEEIPEDMLPQPYEEISVGKRQDPPPQLPDYATPEGILSVPDSAIKRASIPPKVDDYSSLFEDLKEESVSTRNSMSLLPEGMYSSIGDICAPPLPPPLASEHVPIEIRESLDNLADKEAKQYKGLGSQEELSKTVADQIPINDHEQVLADAIEEMEKFASNDVTDGDAPSYTNITYQQNDGHTSREKLNINESEVSYYNTSHKLIASQEEEVEIKQDLYVNI